MPADAMEGRLAAGAVSGPAAASHGWSARNILALSLLVISAMYTQLDRSMVGFLVPMIKADLGLSDSLIGLVVGPAFMVFYMFMVIPVAWVADNTSRRLVVGGGFLFFSLMTLLTGLAAGVWQLALCRALVGAGESTNLGPVKSIVADLFELKHRVVALALTAAAGSISGLLLIPIIGFVAEAHGWRAAFYAAGGSGMAFAVVTLIFLKEPEAGASDGAGARAEKIPLLASLKVLARSPTYVLLAFGAALMSAFNGITSAWESSFLARIHALSIGDAAVLIGPMKASAALFGLFLGAYVAKLMRSDGARALLMPLSALGMAATETVFLLSDAPAVWRTAVVLSGVFLTFHTGVLYTLMSVIVPARVRGMAVAASVVLGHFIGQTIGPAVIGFMNDALAPAYGAGAIRYSLFVAVGAALCGMVVMFLGARRVARGV